MTKRQISIIAGISYLIIFFAAIFANFYVLDSLFTNPLETILNSNMAVRFGILAFLLTVLFDVVVAWALYEIFKNHSLNLLSTFFRLMHASIMGVAIFALTATLSLNDSIKILESANDFNNIWLIGLFFFGFHLIILSKMLIKPRFIAVFLFLAGIMYVVDTCAHFLMPNYSNYADIFLAMVAIPSIFGEMAFTIWLLLKGGKENY